MSKVRNVSGEDRVVPALGGRLVVAGAVVDVDPAEVYGFTVQESNWAPADEEAQAAHDAATQTDDGEEVPADESPEG